MEETRVRSATLYLPEPGGGFSRRDWQRGAGAASGSELRYPAFFVSAEALSARTVFLAVSTPSSMRATVYLRDAPTAMASYGTDALVFGMLIGALGGLAIYLAGIGLVMGEPALTTLAGLAAAFVAYVAADRAMIEGALLPGGSSPPAFSRCRRPSRSSGSGCCSRRATCASPPTTPGSTGPRGSGRPPCSPAAPSPPWKPRST